MLVAELAPAIDKSIVSPTTAAPKVSEKVHVTVTEEPVFALKVEAGLEVTVAGVLLDHLINCDAAVAVNPVTATEACAPSIGELFVRVNDA